MTEVKLKAPVKATNVLFAEGVHDLFDVADGAGKVPGAFNFDGEHFHYCCPCGCGNVGILRAAIGNKPNKGPSWIFNGNSDCPTLTPSINHIGHWHGWLRDGFWIQA